MWRVVQRQGYWFQKQCLDACPVVKNGKDLSGDFPLQIVHNDSMYFKKPEKVQHDSSSESGSDHMEHMTGAPRRSLAKNTYHKRKHSKKSSLVASMSKKSGQHAFSHEASFSASVKASKVDEEIEIPQIIKLIRKHDLAQVETYLEKVPSAMHTKDHFGQTALFWAASGENPKIVELLLEKKALVNVSNKFGYTPLMRAMTHGRIDVGEMLLEQQADLTHEDKFRCNALFMAAGGGHLEACEWLLKAPQIQAVVDKGDIDNCTALLSASKGGHGDVCRLLLRLEAEVNVTDESGRSPLLFALATDDVDLAVTLMGAQADVNAEDEDGKNTVARLVEHICKKPKNRDASLGGLATTLEAKGEPDNVDILGITPLMLATKANDPMVCALLGAYGADCSRADAEERTCLTVARKKGFTEVAWVLEDFGAKKSKENKNLNKALIRSTYYGRMDAVKRLLARGAEINAVTKKGQPLVSVASKQGHTEIMKVIRDAQREAKDNDPSKETHSSASAAVLQKILNDLNVLQWNMKKLQHAVNKADVPGILEAVNESSKIISAHDKKEGTSPVLLGEYMQVRYNNAVRQARKELRILRAEERHQHIRQLCGELELWYSGGHITRGALKKIVTAGTAQIRGVQCSEFEFADKECELEEQRQTSILQPILRWCLEMFDMFIAEEYAYSVIPKDESEDLKSNGLTCPKCQQKFGTKSALQHHDKQCFGWKSKEEEMLRMQGMRRDAEFACEKMKEVITSYKTRAHECKQDIDGVPKKRQEYKDTPGASKIAKESTRLTTFIRTFCDGQVNVMLEKTKQVKEKYGVEEGDKKSKNTKAEFCQSCMVAMASWATIHKNGSPPHICLCAGCAAQFERRLKWGTTTELCPVCHEIIRRVDRAA